MYGLSAALPMSNIGRFCLSTIWMRRPSGVRSSSSWSLNGSSAWLLLMASSSSRFSASSCCCSRSRSVCGIGLAVCWDWNGSLLLPREMSVAPPSLIIEVLAPPGPAMPGAGVELCPTSGLGLRKYSEMAARSGLVVAAISHSTRKNAIIAVTKSA